MDQAPQNHEDGGNKVNNTFACRQGGSGSTRWTPTSEQIRILKDLYYNNGVRSPTAEQIQRISAKLRQYGKIEGKNVFYWFQNHKARERQKKRFSGAPAPTPTPAAHDHIPMNMMTSPPLPPPPSPALRKYYQDHTFSHNLAAATGFPSSSTSSPGVMNVGQVGYGSVAMERSFRDCSISPSGEGSGSGSGQNFVWVGVDPYSSSSGGGGYYPFLEKRKYVDYETLEDEQEDDEDEEIETLPLFPIQSDPTFKQQSKFYNGCQYGPRAEDNSSRASLELTLNSYSSRLLNSP